MSLEKMQSPTVEEKGADRRIEHAEEAVGTLVVDVNETGRHALRPQPSQDPNDPLVRTANGLEDARFADDGEELASAAKVLHVHHHLLLHCPCYGQRVEIHRCCRADCEGVSRNHDASWLPSLLQCPLAWMRQFILDPAGSRLPPKARNWY